MNRRPHRIVLVANSARHLVQLRWLGRFRRARQAPGDVARHQFDKPSAGRAGHVSPRAHHSQDRQPVPKPFAGWRCVRGQEPGELMPTGAH